MVVDEPVVVGDKPGHRLEHRVPSWLIDTANRLGAPARAQRPHLELHLFEAGDRQELTVERGRTGELGMRRRGTQGDRGHVATIGPPDLPVHARGRR